MPASWRQFCDRLHWRLINALTPGLVNAQHHYVNALDRVVKPHTRWLDLGCGRRLFPVWMRDAERRERALVARAGAVVGVDVDAPSLAEHLSIGRRLLADSSHLPFADGAFDLVTANMVVEHLSDPVAVFAEVGRVLAPGGVMLFHTPNRLAPATLLAAVTPQRLKHLAIRLLEHRREQDVFPTHYRCNTPAAVRRCAADAALDVAALGLTESAPQTAMLGPLVAVELLWLRLCRLEALRPLRSNLIVQLRKPFAAGAARTWIEPHSIARAA
jgi:SAM-dependent methyltransferase